MLWIVGLFPAFAQGKELSVRCAGSVRVDLPAPRAANDNFAQSSVPFAKLAADELSHGRVIGQEDEQFRRRGFITSDGGLCGPVSASFAWALLAGRVSGGHESADLPRAQVHFVERLATIARGKQPALDVRAGLRSEDLTEILRDVSAQEGSWLQVSEQSAAASFGHTRADLDVNDRDLAIAILKWRHPLSGELRSHAVLVLAHSVEASTITYFDPSAPDALRTADYTLRGSRGIIRAPYVNWSGRSLDAEITSLIHLKLAEPK